MKQVALFALLTVAVSSCGNANSSAVKWQAKKPMSILSYGKPAHTEMFFARNLVAKKWGLKYKLLGCIVTRHLVDSVKDNNEAVKAAMAAKFGSDWEVRMTKEIDSEFASEQQVIKLLDQQKLTIAKRAQQDRDFKYMSYHLIPVNNGAVYKADVIGWETIKGKNTERCFYKYLVDLKSSSVKLLSDTVTNFNSSVE